MELSLIGRERERTALASLLASIKAGPAALDLSGEAGIGKTTLIDACVGLAREEGFRVLSTRPTQSESRLSFVGLGDLLANARDVFQVLPDPQRLALEVALLLRSGTDAAPDPRAIGMAVLGTVHELSTAGAGVLLAVDDLQWLDPATVSTLSFALRRVEQGHVGLLTASRTGERSTGLDVGRAFTRDSVSLSPLSVGAIQALLKDRLGLSLRRPQLLRLHDLARGNPLVALEVARSLETTGWPEAGRPLRQPADTASLFAARLAKLPTSSRDVLAIVAAAANPSVDLVESASPDRRRVKPALEAATDADVIRREDGRLRFTHPLLASAAYGRLEDVERRDLHRRIAGVVDDLEERARHLALASDGPDAAIAEALEVASEMAARRGAWASAAELAGLGAELTPPGDIARLRLRRRVTAERLFLAGDAGGAREILERLVDETEPGPERARALLELAETYSGDLKAMLPLRRRAIAEAAGDDRVAALAHRELARTLFVAGSPEEAFAEARLAIAAADRAHDVRLLVISLSYLTFLELSTGRLTPGILDRALALESDAGYLRDYESPSLMDGLRLLHLEDDLEAARGRIEAVDRIAREHGDDESRAVFIPHLVDLECRAGRFDDAARYATEVLEIRQQFGLGTAAAQYSIALVETLRGRPDAVAAARRASDASDESGNEVFAISSRWLLGLSALSMGDGASAARTLAELPERLAARGYGLLRQLQVLPDTIEALAGSGDLQGARPLLDRLESIARESRTSLALVRLARCHGFLAAAEGRPEQALEAFDQALELHARLPDPLELGRTLLAMGQQQRRAGRRGEARATIQRALAVFEKIGAALWAEQARRGLAAIGGRVKARRSLTPSEAMVARLVAAGRSNREVAAELFVTVRTVETHLTSIYRKLELRSRAELASRFAERGERLNP